MQRIFPFQHNILYNGDESPKADKKKCLEEKFNFLLFPPGNSVFICVMRAKLMTSPASAPSCRSKLK